MLHNIIAIKRQSDIQAKEAFAHLMQLTEDELNQRAHQCPNTFKGISSSDLEKIACSVIKEMCSGTPFREEEIKLVSGAKFPDIVAEQYFGVEVKSTIKDQWISTGSSIVESTRDKNVEHIYMLFGKLGGEPAFICKPYQEVLSEIAVTHCPRYLINMKLNRGESIFDKMHTTYDQLRTSPDTIEQVRRYYKKKAADEGKIEMPWWLGDSNADDMTTAVNVRFWRDVTLSHRQTLQAQIFILFPEVLESKFDRASLWLCTTHGILNSHMRDTFTAGGTIKTADGVALDKPLPQIIKRLVNSAKQIKQCFDDSEFVSQQVSEFNPVLLSGNTPYDNWLKQVIHATKVYQLPDWIAREIVAH